MFSFRVSRVILSFLNVCFALYPLDDCHCSGVCVCVCQFKENLIENK